MSIPDNAVKLTQPPVDRHGVGCDVDGDVDRFGRVVAYKEGQWYAWYSHPNQPFFKDK